MPTGTSPFAFLQVLPLPGLARRAPHARVDCSTSHMAAASRVVNWPDRRRVSVVAIQREPNWPAPRRKRPTLPMTRPSSSTSYCPAPGGEVLR